MREEKNISFNQLQKNKTIFKRCHICGKVSESIKELSRCPHCNKSFLPLGYFQKTHGVKTVDDFNNLFEKSYDLNEDQLIKGLYALW